ncbi:MAG: cytidylate kinase-like family protein [Treponema sp.]|nr:cytidylate kinase-like family protein [Treponema sp.]
MAILTVSRQVASLGDEICAAVSKKIGYKFITRKDIEKRIIEMGFPEEKFKTFDEKKTNFFASLSKSRDEYLDYLQTAILEAAQDDCVLIGRGANIVLKDLPNHISLRFICDDKTRTQRLMREHGWQEKDALKRIRESDENRDGFLKNFFNIGTNDDTMYHAVLNTGLFDINTVVECVSAIIKNAVSDKAEELGKKKAAELLLSQKIVNTILLTHKLAVLFLRAEKTGERTILLHGVCESSDTVAKAIEILSSEGEFSAYNFKSAISVSKERRIH